MRMRSVLFSLSFSDFRAFLRVDNASNIANHVPRPSVSCMSANHAMPIKATFDAAGTES